jgi:rhomboid protease GluP
MRWKLDRLREGFSRLFMPDPKDQRPRLCPACRALVGSTASKCHECGASLNYSLAAASQSLSGLLPADFPVTYSLMIANLLMFTVTVMASVESGNFSWMGDVDGNILRRLGAMVPFNIVVMGEWWRLVMPIFLHGGLLHILFNCWVLADIGRMVEETYGSPRYLFIYVVTGIASFYVSMRWSIFAYGGGAWSIGASGSLMGLMGLIIAMTKRRGGAYARMIRSRIIQWVIYIFVLGFFFRADHAAHLGGLAAGYMLGLFFADREPVTGPERKRAYLLGWIAGLIVVAAFGAVIARRLMEGNG